MDDASMIAHAVGGAAGNLPPGNMPPGLGSPQGMPQGNPMQMSQGMQSLGMGQESMQEVAGIDRRMRVLEERFTNIRKRSQVEEQNNVRNFKKLQTEIKATDEQLRSLRLDINDLKNKFKILINEIKLYATKEEIRVVEKYVNMWEPVTFVTRAETENIIRRIVEDEYRLSKSEQAAQPNKPKPQQNVHLR